MLFCLVEPLCKDCHHWLLDAYHYQAMSSHIYKRNTNSRIKQKVAYSFY